MRNRPTSRDVARHAGVAQSTVSYVLSGKGSISQDTRERVLAAVAELGYRPNLAARSMRTRRTGRIAILIPTPMVGPAGLLDAAGEVAVAAGYTTEIHIIPPSGPPGARALDVLESGAFEGVLTFVPIAQAAARAVAPGTIVVALNDAFDDQMRTTGELLGADPIREIVHTLAEQGHRRFLHVAGDQTYPSGRRRRAVYQEAVQELGLTDVGEVGGSWTGLEVRAGIDALSDDAPPLAIVAANDVLATAAVQAVLARGWRVPQDVSVTGWDNQPQSVFQTPPLTTVAVDFAGLGVWGMRTLVAHLTGAEAPPRPTSVQRVIWRGTSGPVLEPSD